MTSETDLAAAVATELVKQVPIKEVYEDGLSPAVRETGSALADFVKTLRLALAPLQLTAALQDRYVKFLDRSVRQIPEERRVLPPPQIVGPVLEAIKYEPEDTLISDMYNELLSKAFDRQRVNDAHPAFAPLIRQLSTDEAIILKLIYDKYLEHDYYKLHFTEDLTRNLLENRQIEVNELPSGDLATPEKISVYLEHLDKLGLMSIRGYKSPEAIRPPHSIEQTGLRTFTHFELTEFGLEFMKAVRPSVETGRGDCHG